MTTQTQLFPPEIIQHTTEAYLPTVTVRSQLIYTTVLLAFLAAGIALPFIYVDVSVQSRGLVRTVAEKNELRSLVSGTLAQVAVQENQSVQKGETLFTLVSEISDSKQRLTQALQAEKQMCMADLQKLTASNLAASPSLALASPLYTQQYNQFRFVLLEKKNQLQKATLDLERHQKLHQQKVIATTELEDKQFAYNKLQAECQTLVQTQRSQWQADWQKYRLELAELTAQLRQLAQEKTSYTIKAPVSGSVQQLSGKYAGSFVQAGEVLGIVSPDSNLVAECYVSPRDMGLLKKQMQVKFQIDAFNYNEWGMVSGTIVDIANDYRIIDNQPIFRVRCQLNKQTLQLKNGYQAHLKKGMTLQARFIVTKRSLFQLLYDTADDWLNPAIGK